MYRGGSGGDGGAGREGGVERLVSRGEEGG